MPKLTKRELEKKSRGELVRLAEGAGLPHTGSNEQLVSRLLEAEVESQPAVTEPGQ